MKSKFKVRDICQHLVCSKTIFHRYFVRFFKCQNKIAARYPRLEVFRCILITFSCVWEIWIRRRYQRLKTWSFSIQVERYRQTIMKDTSSYSWIKNYKNNSCLCSQYNIFHKYLRFIMYILILFNLCLFLMYQRNLSNLNWHLFLKGFQWL